MEEIRWKISLFFKCVVMEYKNWKLDRRIQRERKKTDALKEELEKITGEVVYEQNYNV